MNLIMNKKKAILTLTEAWYLAHDYSSDCNCSTVYQDNAKGYHIRKDEFEYENGSLGFTTYLNNELNYPNLNLRRKT